MQLWFARGSEVTIREQLVTQIRLGILSDDLRPGQRLPSTRELARRFRLHPEAVYPRDKIRDVRLEHSDAANVATGAAIGGGIGAAIGASAHNQSLTRPGGALLFGTGGAIIGGFFGKDFPITHGKTIYRR
jgi:hypothetical protein